VGIGQGRHRLCQRDTGLEQGRELSDQQGQPIGRRLEAAGTPWGTAADPSVRGHQRDRLQLALEEHRRRCGHIRGGQAPALALAVLIDGNEGVVGHWRR